MTKNKPDYFADIATALPTEAREPLTSPVPPACPDRVLPLEPAAAGFRRPLPEKITTFGEMTESLGELRKVYAPFMADLAPAIPPTRSSFNLGEFQWREETADDRADFTAILGGKGDWTTVSIPHYGPPLGRASTLYRAEFTLSTEMAKSESLRIWFGGVDYRCQVYVNGLCIGTHEGFFEEFWFDLIGTAKEGRNVLLVRVENDYTMLGENINAIKADGDKVYAATGLGYDDPALGWHHCPAGMGIWNRVRIEALPRLFIDDLWVRPLCDAEEIEICAEVESRSYNIEEDVSLEISIFGQNFPITVVEGYRHRGESKFVRGFGDLIHGFDEITPELLGPGRNYITFRFPMKGFRYWEPETPWLYQLQAHVVDPQGQRIDSARVQFGMRSFVQDEESTPKGKFYLNGREIRLRGANTMGNFERCIMQGDMDQLRDDILLAKLTRMNVLRMTQRPVHREFYDYCDRLGMMVQTDLPLFSTVRRNQVAETARQAGRMERHVRAHPCNILVSFMNEPRPAAANKPHRFIYRDEMERLFDISAALVRQHNPDRVMKYVDGDYDPPASHGMPDNHVYCGWYIGHGIDLGALHQGTWLPIKPGWHYGCGEFGSEGLDSYEVIRKEYPAEWKPATPEAPWTPAVIAMSQSWKFHFLWYDSAENAADWIDRSQEFQSWVTGLQTRAYRMMPGMNTFAIHLFIDAWPAGWMKTIMDVHRVPKKAWFTYRDCLAEQAVVLRTDRTQARSGETIPVEAWICNDHPEKLEGARLVYEVRLNEKTLASGNSPVAAGACTAEPQGRLEVTVPRVENRGVLEVSATLLDASGKPLHDHVIRLDVFPEEKHHESTVHIPSNDPGTIRFAEELGLKISPTLEDGVTAVLLDSPESYMGHQAAIDRYVKEGGIALALPFPAGDYRFGSASCKIARAGMGPRHFVSRKTGHPVVEGFQPNDFRFWYHASLGRVAPILNTVIEASDATTILNSGDGGWYKPWDYCPAAAEFSDGKGYWRICQIEIKDCITHNPAARLFARRMLTMKPNSNVTPPTRSL